MNETEATRLLAGAEFFAGLSPDGRNALAALCVRRELEKRDTLFLEGQRARAVFMLASGTIQLVKTSVAGKEVVIRTVQPGEVFAEAVLFEHDTYPVTALAVKTSVVYELPKREFLRLLDQRVFRDDFIRSLARRLRYLTERILFLSVADVEERFFRFLLSHYGRKERYELTIPKKDIAAEIGVTPETFSRLIRRLEKRRKLRLRGRVLTVPPGAWAGMDTPQITCS